MIADPTRLRVIFLLADRERNVAQMCADIGQSQPTISHHLALLRAGQLVEARRDGKFICYSLTPAGRALALAAAKAGD